MATARSRGSAQRFMQELPEAFLKRVLPGAAKAGALVIADEAKARLGTRRAETAGGGKVLIADTVKVRVKRKGDKIHARIHLEGPGSYVGIWLERGTAPHYISVSAEDRGGKSISRINKLSREPSRDGSLVIGNNFAGASVFHPGARPHPFLNPALDTREQDAIAAAQSFINARATRAGIGHNGGPEIEDAS